VQNDHVRCGELRQRRAIGDPVLGVLPVWHRDFAVDDVAGETQDEELERVNGRVDEGTATFRDALAGGVLVAAGDQQQ
jgi:hypothetical protein